MADYKTKQFFGTAQTVYNATTAIAAGNFSAAGTVFDNTSDASVPYATHAVAMLSVDLTSAPSAVGQVFELWGIYQDVDGVGTHETNDPAATDPNGAHFMGAWVLDNVATLQRREIEISLEGIRKVKPFIKNGSSSATDGTASVVVKMTPFTFGMTV